jgi:protein ImuB
VGADGAGGVFEVRRVAAIVLPDLACELVRQKVDVSGPLGVIIESEAASVSAEELRATAVLDAIDEEARRLGVSCGQRVVEAAAVVAHLAVHRVTREEIEAALGGVAEIALTFGPTAGMRLANERGHVGHAGQEEEPFDTVWLDVTGTAHLVGGEEALIDALCEQVSALGHRARAAIAGGPRIAQALARFGDKGRRSAKRRQGEEPREEDRSDASRLSPLPVQALPIDADVTRFLTQIGITTIGDLAHLPSAAVAARLGPYAADMMSLIRGTDDVPLLPYEPPRELSEEVSFEDGVESTESLLFVLRGMTSRLGVRLASRGEACARLDVTIPYDRSIARLRQAGRGARPAREAAGEGAGGDAEDLCLHLGVDLPAPLAEPADLLRALRAKLERAELAAPGIGLRLVLTQITSARRVQLDLSRDVAVDPDRLPALLAELSAEIGADRVGVLEVVDAHRPEARSRLAPAEVEGRGASPSLDASASPGAAEPPVIPAEPTRLLPTPVPIGRVHQGAVVVIDGQSYVIEKLRFEMRLASVEWWTETPASRDYARAWLVAKDVAKETPGTPVKGAPRGADPMRLRKGGARLPPLGEGEAGARPAGEAWIFVDRATGEGYLQGWSE